MNPAYNRIMAIFVPLSLVVLLMEADKFDRHSGVAWLIILTTLFVVVVCILAKLMITLERHHENSIGVIALGIISDFAVVFMYVGLFLLIGLYFSLLTAK